MTIRPDISDKLVHFTSPKEHWDEAYNRLKSILSDSSIKAGNEKIKGGHWCVCFTEAPLPYISGGLANKTGYSRYAPFGVMFDKKWVYRKGGRPVIYQADSEYDLLPAILRWRHVRYEPTSEPQIDFTWEREWRINCHELQFTPNDMVILLPNIEWRERLLLDHESDQDYLIRGYSLVLDEDIAEQYREDLPWRISCLIP